MINRIILAIQFLTILPLPANMAKKEEYHKVMAYFPLAGLLVGALSLAAFWLSNQVMTTGIALLMALITQFIVTGGLHLDGLADTADGYLSGRSSEKKLEIMRDSRLGTHGVVILLFMILLKLATLWGLPVEYRWLVILMAPVVGRFSLVIGAWKASSPRRSGLGNLFIGVVSIKEVMIALLVVLACLLVRPVAYIPFLLTVLAGVFAKNLIHRQLGGITGDVLGALNELSETLFMLFMLMIVEGS